MVSQVLFISNPDKLISDSRFFLFCGGSIFEKMNGSAREIMDKEAWLRVYNYYSTRLGHDDGFNDRIIPDLNDELLNRSFMLMLKADLNNNVRSEFFDCNKSRLRICTLKKDIVIPTYGVKLALGKKSQDIIDELDFCYDYTHQNHFPLEKSIIDNCILNDAFLSVLERAASFLY